MDAQSLKIDIIRWLTELKDQAVLEKIYAIKTEEISEISDDQKTELDKRLKKYEMGETNFKSWSETRANIRARSKNGL